MNSATVRLPEGLLPAADAVSVEAAAGSEGVVSRNLDAFDTEMAAADKRFGSRARLSAPGDADQRAALEHGELDALDVPALSEYQKGAVRAEEEARTMIVNGFANPVSKELPLEYAVEMNNLIKLEMEGAIG